MGNDDEESTTIASEVVAAMAGGAISASVLYPLEVIKTRMQAATVDNATATTTTTATDEDEEEEEDEVDDAEDDEEYFDSATQQQQQQQQQQKPARAHRGASSSPRGGGGGRSKKTPPQQRRQQRQEQQRQLSMIPFAKQLFRREGGWVFLRGVETSAFQSALEKSLYFFAYTALKEVHATFTGNHKLDAATNLALGCAAEWAHLPVTLPVDAWTTAIQTSSGSTVEDDRSKAPMQILLTMLSDEDTNFYKGISAYYLLCFKPALQYTVYEQVKAAVVQTRTNKTLSAGEAFVLGMIARVVATVVVFPFLRAKVILQTQQKKQERQRNGNDDSNDGAAEANGDGSGNTSNGSNGNGILSVLWQQWEHGGIGGLYHGLGPELTRGVFSAALMLMIKERIALVVRRMLVPSSTTTRRHCRRPLPRSSSGG